MNRENMMLGEGTQTQKTTYCFVPFIGNIQNRQTYGEAKQTGIYWGLGSNCLMAMGFCLVVMKIFCNERGGDHTRRNCSKCLFKMVRVA